MKKWTRLVRFVGTDGKVYSGDAIVDRSTNDARLSQRARVIHGDPFGNYSVGPVVDIGRLLQPIPYSKVRTVRCLGLNYMRHAEESNMPLPESPIVFHKPATAISGPTDHIMVPEMYQQDPSMDYEVELVVIIGKQCYNVSEKDALRYAAGYTVGNDVSHRDWQIQHGSQWAIGKSHDTFAPIGPAIVRNLNPDKLPIMSNVNGELRQSSNTDNMAFGVAQAISFLSKTATLVPGDLIFMGTPEGVGMGFKPPQYLKNGDIVECKIEGIGSIKNKILNVKAKTFREKLLKFTHRKSKL